MIHFLRKIRQKLVVENKTSKYFKYAIGEIVLVVIGILLALQINTWNENRKLKIAEQEILRNLLKELIINKETLNYYLDKHLEGYKSGFYLLTLFQKDISTIPEIKLDSTLAKLEEVLTFEASDGIIKSLIASGKIDIIQNTELKSLITSFDGYVINAIQETETLKLLIHDRLWPSIDGKISSSNRLRTYKDYGEYPKGSYTSDYEWFFKSREMEDIVSNLSSWMKTIYLDEKELSKNIDVMILLVENEIKIKTK
ncbi:DUF6090 family protein [Polaribacter sp.]|uniref:DUF6090 family protein n=1 Tax=Polaribacter sp. TaxID=1920175 RepID=UPI0040475B27